MENPWKPHGKPNGKPMENPWKTHGKPNGLSLVKLCQTASEVSYALIFAPSASWGIVGQLTIVARGRPKILRGRFRAICLHHVAQKRC